MSEATSHAPGIPSWVDLGTPDAERSKAFYSALFGWAPMTVEDPQAGGYTMLMQRDRPVGGLMVNPDHPSAWMTYVATADADATADKVRAAGGTVIFEPMQVMTAGRMAIFVDPTGAGFGVWQAGDHTGAGLINEPGALAWTELQTRDVEAARAFYTTVFGWGTETHAGPIAYTEWKQDGSSIGGMMAMGDQIPAEVPPHWLVYFGAADCDATTARATELGGKVLMPPMDIQDGLRFSVVADPLGAVFGVLRIGG